MFPPFRALALTFSAALLFGCASHQFKAPDSASKKGKKVTASLTHFSPLYLFPPTNLDKLVDDLSEQCGDGKVEGISSTLTSRYFYAFGVLYSHEVAGYCAE
jgi:hypothetical protein